MKRVGALAAVLACGAAVADGKVDPRCQAGCFSQGYVQDFCVRTCTYEPGKEAIPVFGGPEGPEPAPPPQTPAPPPERKPQPPTAALEAFNPARDALRDELRRLNAENAALRKELAATRKALEESQRKSR